MFLFTDAHVADEGFLELINNMLTSGMVPALYDDGEKDGLINSVRDEVGFILCWQTILSHPVGFIRLRDFLKAGVLLSVMLASMAPCL